MITKTGDVVRVIKPSKGTVIPSAQVPYSQADVTGVDCAVCQAFTPMYHQTRIVVGHGKGNSRRAGWDKHNRWYEYLVETNWPILKKFWVCERCYGLSKNPVIPARTKPQPITIGIVKAENKQAKAESTLNSLLVRARTNRPL